mmetsp:Transcript_32586/g.103846  ORF Transcript_32586/g.103846 Transcript_32586/m.103846 type:complete len:225 (+) Transcript_32586:131-805(+)
MEHMAAAEPRHARLVSVARAVQGGDADRAVRIPSLDGSLHHNIPVHMPLAHRAAPAPACRIAGPPWLPSEDASSCSAPYPAASATTAVPVPVPMMVVMVVAAAAVRLLLLRVLEGDVEEVARERMARHVGHVLLVELVPSHRRHAHHRQRGRRGQCLWGGLDPQPLVQGPAGRLARRERRIDLRKECIDVPLAAHLLQHAVAPLLHPPRQPVPPLVGVLGGDAI